MSVFRQELNNPQYDEKKYQEIYEAIIKDYTESGYLKLEILPQLCNKIKSVICSQQGFSALFSHDDLLTLEEKKSLGLPTRKKISREMFNSLSMEGQKLPDPKETLEEMYYYHSSKIERKYQLLEIKSKLSSYNDFYVGYRVIAPLDHFTCIICGAFDDTILKTINDVENYEKHKCLNKICRCIFVPVLKGDEKQTGQNYARWFKKLSDEEKKEILGEYYEKYKAGETLKKIASSFTEETAIKYHQDREKREELRELEESKKPKVRLPKLTEDQLQEYRELLIKQGKPGEWISLPENLEREMDVMKRRTAKEQHIILEHARKKAKKN